MASSWPGWPSRMGASFDTSQALAESGASWYYTWSASHAGIISPPGAQFVPMIWGAASVNAATLSQAKAESNILLGFNEPDMSGQSNMTVAQALSLWPQLMATGMTLGSPAVADDAATPGGWLDQFMSSARPAVTGSTSSPCTGTGPTSRPAPRSSN